MLERKFLRLKFTTIFFSLLIVFSFSLVFYFLILIKHTFNIICL